MLFKNLKPKKNFICLKAIRDNEDAVIYIKLEFPVAPPGFHVNQLPSTAIAKSSGEFSTIRDETEVIPVR